MEDIELQRHGPCVLSRDRERQQISLGQDVLIVRLIAHGVHCSAGKLQWMDLKQAGPGRSGEISQPHQVLPSVARKSMNETKRHVRLAQPSSPVYDLVEGSKRASHSVVKGWRTIETDGNEIDRLTHCVDPRFCQQ